MAEPGGGQGTGAPVTASKQLSLIGFPFPTSWHGRLVELELDEVQQDCRHPAENTSIAPIARIIDWRFIIVPLFDRTPTEFRGQIGRLIRLLE